MSKRARPCGTRDPTCTIAMLTARFVPYKTTSRCPIEAEDRLDSEQALAAHPGVLVIVDELEVSFAQILDRGVAS